MMTKDEQDEYMRLETENRNLSAQLEQEKTDTTDRERLTFLREQNTRLKQQLAERLKPPIIVDEPPAVEVKTP